MLELLLDVCLAERPDVCASRLLPGPCVEERAEPWVAHRPGLTLEGTRCVEAAEAVVPLAVEEVAPGVFVHAGEVALASPENAGDIANLGFVVGEEAVAVIDAGGSRAVGERLYAAIRGRTDLPIRYLILTHMHPDHVVGAAVFAEAGADIVAHEHLPAALAARAESYAEAWRRQQGEQAPIGSTIVLPDETVAGHRTIDLGGRMLEIEAHPTAHTDNDLTVLDRATGTWFMGDLVFDRHLPSIDGSLLGWLALLDELAQRSVERIVPGHGAVTLAWPQGAAPMRGYLEALTKETRAAIARGESMGRATRHLGDDLRDDWQLFDTFNPFNATAAYRELEWE